MKTKSAKWGNVLGIRLPQKLVRDLHLNAGTEFDVSIVDGRIVLNPVLAEPQKTDESLDAMIAAITPENRHAEVDFGTPVGKEAF